MVLHHQRDCASSGAPSRHLVASVRRYGLFRSMGLDQEGIHQGMAGSGRFRATGSAGREHERRRGVWQRRFWEHTLESEDDFERHFDYIHYNPVKHGHVRCPAIGPGRAFTVGSRSASIPPIGPAHTTADSISVTSRIPSANRRKTIDFRRACCACRFSWLDDTLSRSGMHSMPYGTAITSPCQIDLRSERAPKMPAPTDQMWPGVPVESAARRNGAGGERPHRGGAAGGSANHFPGSWPRGLLPTGASNASRSSGDG